MIKKMISVLLAVVLVISAVAITSISTSAAKYDSLTLDPGYLYFDTDGSGWDMSSAKVGFYAFPLSDDVDTDYRTWGKKKLQGKLVDGSETVWGFDASNFKLQAGVQYKIIFCQYKSNSPVAQTYDLFFDTTCLGHVAYCNGTEYENPVDSSKTTMAAFWDGKDAKQYGPVLQISSIGNVIGTCLESGKTAQSVFEDFISVVSGDTGKTGLDNARTYVVDVGTKTEQKLIDDIGKDLSLTADQVQASFTSTGVATTWSYDASTLSKTQPATQKPTQAPTQAPTPAPTNPPTQAPTQAPTPAPTNPPTQAPTQAPTPAPTNPPTQAPTQAPTSAPVTQAPTSAPVTQAPTSAPVTEAPTSAPVTETPTSAPVTEAPTSAPVTEAPTQAPPVEVVRGDADGNNKLESTDATWIQRYIVKLITASEINLANADADQDGIVDIIDATLIQRVLAEICNWDKIPTNA